MKTKYPLNQAGFSFIQVRVAFASAGVLATVVMKISQNMSSVQGEAEGSLEETELKSEIRNKNDH